MTKSSIVQPFMYASTVIRCSTTKKHHHHNNHGTNCEYGTVKKMREIYSEIMDRCVYRRRVTIFCTSKGRSYWKISGGRRNR